MLRKGEISCHPIASFSQGSGKWYRLLQGRPCSEGDKVHILGRPVDHPENQQTRAADHYEIEGLFSRIQMLAKSFENAFCNFSIRDVVHLESRC